MKGLRINRKLVLAVAVILSAILIFKVALFVTAKPKITVDYVAEYNRRAQPENYDANANAGPYYEKAFDDFVHMPDELKRRYVDWPTGFNNAEEALLEEWLISNFRAFGYFREAVSKPYYWLERRVGMDKCAAGMMVPELGPLRELSEAVIWDAKLKAVKGGSRAAFENILDCYRAGKHKCQASLLLMDQHFGLGIKQAAVRNALIILDKSQMENNALEFLQHGLEVELKNDSYMPNMRPEKVFLYDALQRSFIDDGKGTGRFAWSVGWFTELYCTGSTVKGRLKNCLVGPTRNETVEDIEQVIAICDQVMPKTPWEIKNEGYDYFGNIDKLNNSNFFLRILGVT